MGFQGKGNRRAKIGGYLPKQAGKRLVFNNLTHYPYFKKSSLVMPVFFTIIAQ